MKTTFLIAFTTASTLTEAMFWAFIGLATLVIVSAVVFAWFGSKSQNKHLRKNFDILKNRHLKRTSKTSHSCNRKFVKRRSHKKK